MAATVTLDAGLLVFPPGDVTAAETRTFVENLLGWARLLDEGWVTVLTSKRAWEALDEDGFLYFHGQLAKFLNMRGVVEYSANDVTQVMDRLLYHPPWLEERLSVEDVQLRWDQVATQPDILSLCAGPNLRRETTRCIILIALYRRGGGEHHVIALRQTPQPVVHVRARIHREVGSASSSGETEDLESTVLTCHDVPGLISCMDECELLRSATDDNAVHLACRVALFKARQKRGSDIDWESLSGWRVGGHFREAARRCCRDSAESFAGKLLRAVSETIDDENLRAAHPLRTGPGGNDPQRRRSRDQATAWRRDIDDEYHLHYWRLADGLAELSWVGPHNDFGIPE